MSRSEGRTSNLCTMWAPLLRMPSRPPARTPHCACCRRGRKRFRMSLNDHPVCTLKELLLELLSKLFKLFLQIVDFSLEFADSIRLHIRLSESYFTRKQMCVTDFLLAGLPGQADNERGLCCHERIQHRLHFPET